MNYWVVEAYDDGVNLKDPKVPYCSQRPWRGITVFTTRAPARALAQSWNSLEHSFFLHSKYRVHKHTRKAKWMHMVHDYRKRKT